MPRCSIAPWSGTSWSTTNASSRTLPEGKGHIDLVCTYEVRAGKIVDAWILAGPKQLAS